MDDRHSMRDVLAVVLAGGAGERLYPLTRNEAKPAVHFGGMYRIIDFTLSNCINSQIRKILVLVQHVAVPDPPYSRGLEPVLSGMGRIHRGDPGPETHGGQLVSGHRGRHLPESVFHSAYREPRSDGSLGDHIYKMDYQKMVKYHRPKGRRSPWPRWRSP